MEGLMPKSILTRYSHEINAIKNDLKQLRSGRVYEKSGVQSDGYLSTRADKLEEKIVNLLYLIENDEPSVSEKFAEFAN